MLVYGIISFIKPQKEEKVNNDIIAKEIIKRITEVYL
jgi:hypothetical protein